MHVDIRGQDFTLSPSLLEHLERRLRLVLARFDGRLTRVAVHIAAMTGSEGGLDKRCRITARLRPVGDLVVEARGLDPRAAIDVAVDRIGRSVRREVERLHDGGLSTSPRTSTRQRAG